MYYPGEIPDARVSPLLAESLVGQPPAYIQVSGADVLRDEAIAYADALTQAESVVPISFIFAWKSY
jgi:acetyl esterase